MPVHKKASLSQAPLFLFALLSGLLLLLSSIGFYGTKESLKAASDTPFYFVYKFLCEKQPGFTYTSMQPKFLTKREFTCMKTDTIPQPKGTCMVGKSCLN